MRFQNFIPFFILLFFVLPNTVFGQNELTKNQIAIKIDGYTGGGGICRLLGVFADQNYLADTATLSAAGDVLFQRKGNMPYKPGIYFVVLPNSNDNFTILLTETDQTMRLRTRVGNYTGAMQVEGSRENEVFYEFQRFQTDLEARYAALGAQLRNAKSQEEANQIATTQGQLLEQRDTRIAELPTRYPDLFFTRFKIAGQNPKLPNFRKPNGQLDTAATAYYFRQHFWDGFDFSDARLLRTPVFFNKMRRYIKDLTLQQPDSLVTSIDFLLNNVLKTKELFEFSANWIALEYKPTKSTMMDAERVYMHVVETFFTPERAIWSKPDELTLLRADFPKMKACLLGNTGQNVFGTNAKGKKCALYDLASPIKIVYIYTPDCEHCQEETPKLAQFYTEWRSRGVEIFSIASMAEQGKWQEFQKKYSVIWENDVIDPQLLSGYHEKYHIDITPEIYVLDQNNKIVAKNLKPEQLPEICARILGGMPK